MFRKIAFIAAAAAALVSADDAAVTPDTTNITVPVANIKVTCQPKSITYGTPFFLNLVYHNDIKRPLAVHVDVLNADTFAYITGDVVKVHGAKGKVTARLVVPPEAAGQPLSFNAFLTPRGEAWPNTLAVTTFAIDIDDKVHNACAPVKNTAHAASEKPDTDYIVLADYPAALFAGSRTPISVQYNYQDAGAAIITTSLVRNSDNYVIASVTKDAEQGEHTVKVPLDVPREIGQDPVHLTANITPVGKNAATDAVAEDRAWTTSIQYQRLRK